MTFSLVVLLKGYNRESGGATDEEKAETTITKMTNNADDAGCAICCALASLLPAGFAALNAKCCSYANF